MIEKFIMKMNRDVERLEGTNQRNVLRLWRNEEGSLIVEAAVLLPVFLIGILILAYLIKGLYIQESVHAIAADQAVKLSIESAAAGQLHPEITYGFRLNERIHELDPDSDFHVISNVFQHNEDILIRLQYEIPMHFPVSFDKRLMVSESLMVRNWTGNTGEGTPFSFAAMEREDDSHTVYVFPKAGERFHRDGCRYVSVYPTERILTEEVRKRYTPCKLCNAKALGNGSVVYCFGNSGEAYHRFDCSSVSKYVIVLPEEDAKNEGYGACSKCM